MEKRTFLIGAYDTALYGWTLTGWSLSDPEQKTNYVEKPDGDGSWDLSTVLSDGLPLYKDRTLTVTLECSEGTREERLESISYMVNLLDGLVHDIVPPDYPSHYITGRVHVAQEYNDLAHAAVVITAVCNPWIYRKTETVVTLTAGTAQQLQKLKNHGRLAVVPKITVTGTGADVLLTYGAASIALTAGVYEWPALVLTPGNHELHYSGSGTVKITYREAVLR